MMILMVKTKAFVHAKAAKKVASAKSWYISRYFSKKADFRAFLNIKIRWFSGQIAYFMSKIDLICQILLILGKNYAI